MKRIHSLGLALSLALALNSADRAEADPILLDSDYTSNGTSYSIKATAGGARALFAQITLNQATTIDEIDMSLAGAGLTQTNVYVEFYSSNAGGDPGSYLSYFALAPSTPTFSSSFQNVAFTNGAGVSLAAGTYYVGLFDNSQTYTLYWNQDNGDGTYSTQYGSITGKVNNGTDHSPVYLQFVVYGAVVPEPSSLVMVGLGGAGVAVAAWRRRRRAATA